MTYNDDYDDEFEEDYEEEAFDEELWAEESANRAGAVDGDDDLLLYSMDIDELGRGTVSITNGADGIRQFTSEQSEFSAVVRGINEGLGYHAILESLHGYLEITHLSERVSIADGRQVLFDGKPVENATVTAIKRYHEKGEPLDNIVTFMEKLEDNASRRTREELFKWAERETLKFTDTGDIIGWKSVYWNDGDPHSVHSGNASVTHPNGVVEHFRNTTIPNPTGATVWMPRRDVQDDPTVECSYGLHVGSRIYAETFSGDALLMVQVSPEDVVSVPKYDTNKMRVCKYTILDCIQNPKEDKGSKWDNWDEVVDDDTEDQLEALIEDKTLLGRIFDRMRHGLRNS